MSAKKSKCVKLMERTSFEMLCKTLNLSLEEIFRRLRETATPFQLLLQTKKMILGRVHPSTFDYLTGLECVIPVRDRVTIILSYLSFPQQMNIHARTMTIREYNKYDTAKGLTTLHFFVYIEKKMDSEGKNVSIFLFCFGKISKDW